MGISAVFSYFLRFIPKIFASIGAKTFGGCIITIFIICFLFEHYRLVIILFRQLNFCYLKDISEERLYQQG